MKKNGNIAVFAISLVLLVVLVNLISLQGFLRLDLTRDRKFTLSDASVETVRDLPDTLTVSAYFSENLPPPYAQHARYVKDLLEEYAAASTGKFAFEFADPANAETEEDKALKKEMRKDIFGRLIREPTSIEMELSNLGLQPVEIRVIEDDQQQTKRAYMGVVIRFQEKHEVIPVVQNLSDLEKDMTSLMRKLVRVREPRLGIIKDIGGPSIDKVSHALRQNMTVENVDLKAEGEISDELNALLIVGVGDHFGDKGAEKIERFLKKGKSAAFMMDRFNVDPRSFRQTAVGDTSKTQKVFELLKRYGIEVEKALVADAACASLNVQENRGGFTFSLPIKYPFVPELMNLSYESPISKGLSGVILPFASSLKISEIEGLDTVVLARSSKVSWIEREPLDLNPKRNWGEADISPDGPYDLMVQARNVAKASAPSKKEVDTNQENLDLENESLESRIVVVGTSAFMWDDFLSMPNQVLSLNIVDWMLADSALLEMRAREFTDAPIDADLSDGVRQAVKFGNILGVPIMLVLFGLLRWRMRESRRRLIRKNH